MSNLDTPLNVVVSPNRVLRNLPNNEMPPTLNICAEVKCPLMCTGIWRWTPTKTGPRLIAYFFNINYLETPCAVRLSPSVPFNNSL